jgi:alkylation response protein AidB-like acyl-CoA dehydrogenase
MDFNLSVDQANVQSLVREFAQEEVAPLSREMDEQGTMPPDLILRLGAAGILGGPLPTEFGGGGWDHLSLALAYEELGRVDSSVRGLMTVHTSLVAQTILRWGNRTQQANYLPQLVTGEVVACYCLTEENAGSDVASLETTAHEQGDQFILNGEKIWITNGGIAGLALVFATLDPALGHKGITAFLVDGNAPGLDREKMPGAELGHRASDHARIIFGDCSLPGSSLFGRKGEGFAIAMSALEHGRLGVAAGALGVAQACLDASIEFSRQRRQFGKRIADFEMIQASIAEMAADVEAARLLVYRAAWQLDQGQKATRHVSIAKFFAVEAALRAANEAVLIHGGRGYSNVYPVERY